MIKRLIIALVLGGALFGGICFFSNKESSEDTLKKGLADNYSSFKNIADYMRANPKTVVIYKKDVKDDPSLVNDFDRISDAGIMCVWNRSGAVEFDTGKETLSSDSHYIIYSPDGKPKDHPDAADAGKENWYIY